MKAAVVHQYEAPPRYGEFESPVPQDNESRVKVRAAALTPLVKFLSSGKHYSAAGQLPMIPGIDGAGRLDDGRRVFFAFPRSPFGSMAEATVIANNLYVEIPDDVDDVTAAAAGNPGMAAWTALVDRARFVPDESVLINGATGATGRLAIQLARHLGAKRIVVTGRNARSEHALRALGADAFIALDLPAQELVQAVQDEFTNGNVRVVLDHLWGASAEHIIAAVATLGKHRPGDRVRFVQIGNLAGATITMPAAALRSSGLELMGTGLGSVSNPRLVQNIGALLGVFRSAKLTIDAESVPLTDVATAWHRKTQSRIVFTL